MQLRTIRTILTGTALAASLPFIVTLHGDYSGGDTEGTFSVSAHAGYKTGSHTFLAGWRHLEIDLLSGRGEDLTVEMSGPIIAYGFRF